MKLYQIKKLSIFFHAKVKKKYIVWVWAIKHVPKSTEIAAMFHFAQGLASCLFF